MNNILFKCPHCNKSITMEDLKNNESNWSLIQKFLDDLKEHQKNELKNELRKDFSQELNNKILLKEQEMLNEFNNQKNELILKINSKEMEITNLNNQKQLEIDNKILAFKNEFEKQKNGLISEYEKRISDLTQANREFKIINSKRKGENFEHEVEAELQKAFSLYDVIDKLTIGETKADYSQTIKNSKNEIIGKIIYEVKNAEWNNGWVAKLAADVAKNNTKYGILIATSFNDKYHGIPFIKSSEYENIWICDSESFIFVGQIIRRMIELEYDIFNKTKSLTNSTNNKIIKELEKQKEKLNEYWTIQFPITYKKIKSELSNLEKISSNLENNANKINKSIDVIKQHFINKVTKSLSSILGDLNFDEEE